MEEEISENYYLKNKSKIMKRYNNLVFNHFIKHVEDRFDEDELNQIKDQIYTEYQDILPQIPYIGGKKNYWTSLFIDASIALVVIKVLKSKGLTAEEIGKVFFDFQESRINQKSWLGRFSIKLAFMSRFGKWYWKRLAKKSKKTIYEDDFIFDYVPGDGDFEYGVNFTRCPLVDFFKNHGAGDITPYICLADYATVNTLGYGFRRTKTIAMGADDCDHRFYKSKFHIEGWQPEKFEDYREWKKLTVVE
ncbi:MAG: L-2-amino-thiazoline-4-carboxylic acid hydrolase [Candidatus Kariarchaeaceae archaeon]